MTFNHKLIVKTIATILLLEGLAMLPSVYAAKVWDEPAVFRGLLITAISCIYLGFLGRVYTKKHRSGFKVRESYFVVFVCWATVITAGIFPYVLSGQGYSLIDALFETVASWTTSSSWVLPANELPPALVLWKATSNWLGGMGVILLAIILLSTLSAGGQKLAGAELPGPELVKTDALMKDTAKQLYGIYLLLSSLDFLCLKAGGLNWFESLINAMTSMSTAGVIDYNNAWNTYFTPYIKLVLILFSILSALNFFFYVRIAQGHFKHAVHDYEVRFFLILLTAGALIMAVSLAIRDTDRAFSSDVIDAFAGAASFMCTAGFPIASVEHWPALCKTILLLMMIIGGCSGSTCGGVKVIRFAVFLKLIGRGMYKRIHPHAVKPVMLKNNTISALNASSISCFILLFAATYLIAAAVLSLENLDMETTMSAPIALFTNTGVGFGRIGDANYGMFSPAGRVVCAIVMLLGRLEMYAVLILFSRSFWNSNRAA